MISPRLEGFFIEYFRLTLLNDNKGIVNKMLNKIPVFIEKRVIRLYV